MKLKIVLLLAFGMMFFPTIAQEPDTITAEEIFAMSFDELMDVEVVSASRYSQKISSVPATMKVISSDQIRKRGYFTLDDVLADLPGFQFRNIQGFNSYSFLRGIPSQNNLILVMINGVEVNELNSGGFYGGGQYNLLNVDRIEVVYGPASVVYGTNAVSGIVNIITNKPEKESYFVTAPTLGNFETSNVDFVYQYANDDFGILLSGMLKRSNKAKLKGRHGGNFWSDDLENFERDRALDLSLRYKQFNFGVNFMEKRASRSTNYRSVGDKYLDRGTLWDIMFLNAFADYEVQKGKNHYKSRLYYRNATVKDNTIGYIEKETDSLPGKQVGYYRPNFQVAFENQYSRNISDKFEFVSGIDMEYEQLSQSFSKSFSDGQDIKPPKPEKPLFIENYLLSLYAQGQYTIVDNLNFTVGIRQDLSDYYGNVFTPRSALVWNLKGFTAKLMYNEAYRAPKPWDFSSGIGNPNLSPERMKSTEAAFSYFFNTHLMLESNLYHNKIKGLLIKESMAGSWYWMNRDEITTMGLELGLTYKAKNWDFYLNYSFTDSQDQDGEEVPEIAKHMLNSGFSASIFSEYHVHVRANYIGSRNNPSNNFIEAIGGYKIDDALVFHTTLTYTGMPNVDFQLSVNNLFDVEYYHTSNRR